MQDLSGIGQVSDIQIDGGRTLRFLKAGTGAPLILMHTIRTQLDYFQEVIPQLAQHYTVYAVDLPGHGYSSIDTKASYDEPYFRSAVIAFIEKLDLREVTLVGESIGAVLALTVASALPERIKAVVSSNTYDYDARYADGVRRGNFIANFILGQFAIPVLGAVFAAMENKPLLGLIMRGGLRMKRWMPNQLLTEFNRAGYRKGYRYVERNVFANWRSWSKARSKYAGVKAPVKLIYGEHDWSTLDERQRTAKELGGVAITTVANTGHFAFVDNPRKLVELVLAE
ncbi:MAG: alpha/beta fold hydrolase [Methylophilaceae bacterium]|nr:alpha/beta hydrolase [Methylophilaceae bacterium]